MHQSSADAHSDGASATDNTWRDARDGPRLKLNKPKASASTIPRCLAVSALLLSNYVTQANSVQNFKKVDIKTPKGKLDASEFEQYYFLMNRGEVTKTDRSLYFEDSDLDKDSMLSEDEAAAHE